MTYNFYYFNYFFAILHPSFSSLLQAISLCFNQGFIRSIIFSGVLEIFFRHPFLLNVRPILFFFPPFINRLDTAGFSDLLASYSILFCQLFFLVLASHLLPTFVNNIHFVYFFVGIGSLGAMWSLRVQTWLRSIFVFSRT